jgi:hypothetical protein
VCYAHISGHHSGRKRRQVAGADNIQITQDRTDRKKLRDDSVLSSLLARRMHSVASANTPAHSQAVGGTQCMVHPPESRGAEGSSLRWPARWPLRPGSVAAPRRRRRGPSMPRYGAQFHHPPCVGRLNPPAFNSPCTSHRLPVADWVRSSSAVSLASTPDNHRRSITAGGSKIAEYMYGLSLRGRLISYVICLNL